MTTTTIEIRPMPASGPGALPGFGGECSICGMLIASSSESSVIIDARRHAEWHERRGS